MQKIHGTHVGGWIPKAGTALGGLEPPRRTRPRRVLPGAVCEDNKTIDPHDSNSARPCRAEYVMEQVIRKTNPADFVIRKALPRRQKPIPKPAHDGENMRE